MKLLKFDKYSIMIRKSEATMKLASNFRWNIHLKRVFVNHTWIIKVILLYMWFVEDNVSWNFRVSSYFTWWYQLIMLKFLYYWETLNKSNWFPISPSLAIPQNDMSSYLVLIDKPYVLFPRPYSGQFSLNEGDIHWFEWKREY